MNLKQVTAALSKAEKELVRAQKKVARAGRAVKAKWSALSSSPTKPRYKAYCKAVQAHSEASCAAAWAELQLDQAVRATGRARKKAPRKKAAKKAPRKKAAKKARRKK